MLGFQYVLLKKFTALITFCNIDYDWFILFIPWHLSWLVSELVFNSIMRPGQVPWLMSNLVGQYSIASKGEPPSELHSRACWEGQWPWLSGTMMPTFLSLFYFRAAMVDRDMTKISAIQSIFPRASVFLCWFHVLQVCPYVITVATNMYTSMRENYTYWNQAFKYLSRTEEVVITWDKMYR